MQQPRGFPEPGTSQSWAPVRHLNMQRPRGFPKFEIDKNEQQFPQAEALSISHCLFWEPLKGVLF